MIIINNDLILTRNELLLPRVWPPTVGLSGKERELDLFVTYAGALTDDPYPGKFCKVFKPKPDPRRDADAAALAIFKFEQYEMFDLRRELCRSNVFCAENGDGRTKYLRNVLFRINKTFEQQKILTKLRINKAKNRETNKEHA